MESNMVLSLNYFMVLVSNLSNDRCGNALTMLCSEGGDQMRVQEGPCCLVRAWQGTGREDSANIV